MVETSLRPERFSQGYPSRLPILRIFCQTSPMRNLTATLCLTVAVLLGSVGMSWGADLQKGNDAYDRGDYATALREWRPLAEQGVALAQFNLGWMYDNGEGVPQNDKTAVKWYTLAADQGDADAHRPDECGCAADHNPRCATTD